MNNSSRFFCNKDCEYFPCHKTDDPENFNCLFCYCPLHYLMDKCPGKASYIVGGEAPEGKYRCVKDCSECMFPHVPENYDKIMEILAEKSLCSHPFEI